MRGRCHLCKTTTQVEFCSSCSHYFCADCRGRYFSRGIAALEELIKGHTVGCCGPVFKEGEPCDESR